MHALRLLALRAHVLCCHGSDVFHTLVSCNSHVASSPSIRITTLATRTMRSFVRHTDLRNQLGRATSMEAGEAVAAELKRRLMEAEARGDEMGRPKQTVQAQSGPHTVPPYWICQPRVRDLEKDARTNEEDRKRSAEAAAAKAAKRAAKKARLDTAAAETDATSPTVPPPIAVGAAAP
eukprot:m.102056 g.102056  ORF g.102056 m.102056 type:complete len:178 (+) comp10422_c1_seq1:1236-1769(+)